MAENARRLVVVGGSAGSFSALGRLVADLPEDFPADVLAVVHLSPTFPSNLAATLAGKSRLPVEFARSGQEISQGHVFLAPPNHHLLVRETTLQLSHGPKENLSRPAIDPLFRTAAAAWGAGVIGVVLSGMLDDGTAGLRAIKRSGGIAVIQSPADAEQPDMPQSAADFVEIDHVVTAAGLAGLLDRLVRTPLTAAGTVPDGIRVESAIDWHGTGSESAEDSVGQRSTLTCPECGGVLWNVNDGDLLRYRCHTGHAYTGETIDVAHGHTVEKALWSAVRVHRERVALAREVIAKALRLGNHRIAETWQRRAESYDRDADVILSLLLRGQAEAEGR